MSQNRDNPVNPVVKAIQMVQDWGRNTYVHLRDNAKIWGSCKFLVETPLSWAGFNSDGWGFRYRSAASRSATDFLWQMV